MEENEKLRLKQIKEQELYEQMIEEAEQKRKE